MNRTLKTLLGTTVLAGLVIAGQAHAQERPLTVVSFGGAYGAAQKKHQVDPYAAETGKKVVMESYAGGVAEMTAQVQSGNIQWDVVDIESIDLERACAEGLLEVIPRDILLPGDDGTPAKEDFFPVTLENECGIGVMLWGNIFAYNNETVGNVKPTTLEDFFNVEKIPGKRALRKRPQVNMEWALLADGVAPEKVYDLLATPEGQARAFAKLDTIKDHVVWYDSWSQAPQLLNDGGAVMVQSANGRIYNAIADENRPFTIVWDNTLFDMDVWSILKGSPNKEQALEFIAFTTRTKPLVGFQDVAYGPARKSSQALVDPDVLPHLPSSHLDKGMKANNVFWADYGESLTEKFNEWLLK
ncbi:ABC transporter substrate-binding protein [Pusillimonas sp. DMV24BSW_D]|uniref:ABC transporter substrate-binding protein n=1 Tax=Neopusillimonas aestuarii TaxID=2716226 RepID=UPI00140DE4F7|nr:ABC transporter substrate-binding protein [Pusillimonas sp. DMV24BSW_D]QIM49839.1 ABC transporter substrate-binding protein [Pusillimonas sp. DMV24BSW_D]